MFRFSRSIPIRGIITHFARTPRVQLAFSPSRFQHTPAFYPADSTGKPQVEQPLVESQLDESQPGESQPEESQPEERLPEVEPEDAVAETQEQDKPKPEAKLRRNTRGERFIYAGDAAPPGYNWLPRLSPYLTKLCRDIANARYQEVVTRVVRTTDRGGVRIKELGCYVPKGILPDQALPRARIQEVNRATRYLQKTYPNMPPKHKAEIVISLCREGVLAIKRDRFEDVDKVVASYVQEKCITGEHVEEEMQQKIGAVIAEWQVKSGKEEPTPVPESE